jgi:hypothetical protein
MGPQAPSVDSAKAEASKFVEGVIPQIQHGLASAAGAVDAAKQVRSACGQSRRRSWKCSRRKWTMPKPRPPSSSKMLPPRSKPAWPLPRMRRVLPSSRRRSRLWLTTRRRRPPNSSRALLLKRRRLSQPLHALSTRPSRWGVTIVSERMRLTKTQAPVVQSAKAQASQFVDDATPKVQEGLTAATATAGAAVDSVKQVRSVCDHAGQGLMY